MKQGKMRKLAPECAQRTFLVLAVFQTAVLLGILLFCNIKYEVSDDFVMEMILSGAYSGKNDVHIMFSNVLWACLLLPWYKIFPDISWYLFGQLVVCFLSFLAVSYVISHVTQWCTAVTSVVVITAFTAMDLYILPQFTKTATTAVMAGSLLFLWALFYQKPFRFALMGAILALVGSWIRFATIYIAAPFVAIILIYETISRLRIKQTDVYSVLRCVFLPGVMLVALVYGCAFLDDFVYSLDEDYAHYRSYSSARAGIVDYPTADYGTCASELSQIGISENDYQMILSWSFGDEEVFSLEKMQQVSELMREYRKDRWVSKLGFVRMILERQLRYPGALCCVVLGLYCVILNWRNMWLPMLSAAVILGFFFYYYMLGRVVYRIEFGYFFCAAVLIACYCRSDGLGQTKAVKGVMSIMAALVVLPQLRCYIPDQSYRQLDQTEYREYVDQTLYYSWDYDPKKYTKRVVPGAIHPDFIREAEENPDQLYILDFDTTIQTLYYDFSPFKSAKSVFPKNLIYLGGVTVNHPAVVSDMEGVDTRNLLEALLKENVIFVSNHTAGMVHTYLLEHVNSGTQLEQAGCFDGYSLWSYTLENY